MSDSRELARRLVVHRDDAVARAYPRRERARRVDGVHDRAAAAVVGVSELHAESARRRDDMHLHRGVRRLRGAARRRDPSRPSRRRSPLARRRRSRPCRRATCSRRPVASRWTWRLPRPLRRGARRSTRSALPVSLISRTSASRPIADVSTPLTASIASPGRSLPWTGLPEGVFMMRARPSSPSPMWMPSLPAGVSTRVRETGSGSGAAGGSAGANAARAREAARSARPQARARARARA